jgi:hypothetical protein
VNESAPVDFSNLLAEIQQEVERRRAVGDVPPDFERQLDRTFASLTPPEATDDDFDGLLARLEAAALIDTWPPTVSTRPGVAQIKRSIARATGFYIRHIASQVSSQTRLLVKALRLLSDRVDRIDQNAPGRRTDLWLDIQRDSSTTHSSVPPGNWREVVIGVLQGRDGRVLHAEAGDGRLVSELIEAGFDAYGVEPVEETALLASDRAPDIRADDAVSHLRILPVQSLGGLIVSGCVERLPIGALMDLVELAASRLLPGGALVVISTHPAAWARGVSPVCADLAAGHPLHPETWLALLRLAGFSGMTVHLDAGQDRLPEVPGEGESTRVTNENFARLHGALFGAAAFAVTALSRP